MKCFTCVLMLACDLKVDGHTLGLHSQQVLRRHISPYVHEIRCVCIAVSPVFAVQLGTHNGGINNSFMLDGTS